MGLTREQILEAQRTRELHRVHVPAWGGDVILRTLSVRDQIELGDGKDPKDLPLLVLVACVVDEQGEPLFTEDDIEALGKLDAPPVLAVFTEAAKLNGLTSKELEEAMQRFEPTPAEISSSG